MNQERIAEVVRKVALALAYAHARGVVHRDLKPSNILIDGRGEPVVTDFGLARRAESGDPLLTRAGVPVGTPAYMSPEQVAGKPVGPASDVFSLGVVLYQLLAGRLPYSGGAAEVLVQVATEVPPPPSSFRPGTDRRLEAACLKALAKSPADRFASMEEFAAALGDTPKPKPARRRAAALVALSVLAVAVVVWGTRPGPQQEQKVAPPPRPVAANPPVIFRGHTGAVLSVAFDAGSSNVLSAGKDHTVRRWDATTGKQVGDAWTPARGAELFAFAPDGRRVLTHFLTSEVFDTTTQTKVGGRPVSSPHTKAIAISRDGRRIAVGVLSISGKDAFVAVVDLDANVGDSSPPYPEPDYIRVVTLTADGKRGASAAKDGVRVWEVGAKTFLRHWPNLPATALALTPDGTRLLTGNALGTVVLRDPATGRDDGRFDGHTAAITSLSFSADGRVLLTGSDDGTARVWSVAARKESRKLAGHDGSVQTVSLAADGRRALTGGKDGTVRLWDLADLSP